MLHGMSKFWFCYCFCFVFLCCIVCITYMKRKRYLWTSRCCCYCYCYCRLNAELQVILLSTIFSFFFWIFHTQNCNERIKENLKEKFFFLDFFFFPPSSLYYCETKKNLNTLVEILSSLSNQPHLDSYLE